MKHLIRFTFAAAFSILSSCTNNNTTSTNSPETQAEITTDTTQIDSAQIKELVIKWNEALVKLDTHALNALYTDKVSTYGTLSSKQNAIAGKAGFFKKYPDFTQSIEGNITVNKLNEREYKASFSKSSSYNGNKGKVMAYLIFENTENGWKINNESDGVTDKNISEKQKKQEELLRKKRADDCLSVATRAIFTSPRCKQAVEELSKSADKNKAMLSFGFIINSSPNPEEDMSNEYSETYDISLHENYEDRIVNVAFFRFDPKDKQVYEYDVVSASYISIDFDKNLMKAMPANCK